MSPSQKGVDWSKLAERDPEVIDPKRVSFRDVPIRELLISVTYMLLGCGWIIFSDRFFGGMMGAAEVSMAVQTFKGVNFVLTTGILLYLVLRRSFRHQRRAEEALRLSQERFEAVALATNDAVWDWNLDTGRLWWSDGMQKIFGYGAADISNHVDWWRERLHPEDRERVTKTIRGALDRGARSWAGHYRFRRKDGSYAVVLDRGQVVNDPAGKAIRLVGGITDISERRKAEEALESSQSQLRALAGRLQSAREEERANVAREIHDELGQVLTALKMNLDWLERKISQGDGNPSMNRLLDRVVESGEIIDSAISGVQRIAADLRPELLDHVGLPEALAQEARQFEARAGIPCPIELPAGSFNIPPETATAVFRIFQEALTNVTRHAQASQVRAALRVIEQQLTLEIVDNGRGIPLAALTDVRSLGLLGMRERALGLGGEVSVSPAEPRGTRVLLRLPLPAPVVARP